MNMIVGNGTNSSSSHTSGVLPSSSHLHSRPPPPAHVTQLTSSPSLGQTQHVVQLHPPPAPQGRESYALQAPQEREGYAPSATQERESYPPPTQQGRDQYTPHGRDSSYVPQGREPSYSQQGREPSYSQQGREPSYSQQGREPTYSQQSREPSYSQQVREPSYPQQGREPSYAPQVRDQSYASHGREPTYSRHVQMSPHRPTSRSRGHSSRMNISHYPSSLPLMSPSPAHQLLSNNVNSPSLIPQNIPQSFLPQLPLNISPAPRSPQLRVGSPAPSDNVILHPHAFKKLTRPSTGIDDE